MKKQEVAQKMIINCINRWEAHREITLDALVKLIMRNLSEMGVVIKVKRKPPKDDEVWERIMEKYNYYYTESLIEESK